MDGSGLNVTVHFTKTQGAPVRYLADESQEAAGIREPLAAMTPEPQAIPPQEKAALSR